MTRRGAELARRRGVALTFSITTNCTLLTEADAAFFEEFGFAVTVSLDGPAEVHDLLRPYKGGQGSFARVMNRVRPLLALQRRMQVTARVTVTPKNLRFGTPSMNFWRRVFTAWDFHPSCGRPMAAMKCKPTPWR